MLAGRGSAGRVVMVVSIGRVSMRDGRRYLGIFSRASSVTGRGEGGGVSVKLRGRSRLRLGRRRKLRLMHPPHAQALLGRIMARMHASRPAARSAVAASKFSHGWEALAGCPKARLLRCRPSILTVVLDAKVLVDAWSGARPLDAARQPRLGPHGRTAASHWAWSSPTACPELVAQPGAWRARPRRPAWRSVAPPRRHCPPRRGAARVVRGGEYEASDRLEALAARADHGGHCGGGEQPIGAAPGVRSAGCSLDT